MVDDVGVIVTARTIARPEGAATARGKKMVLASEDGAITVTVRYAPRAVSYSNLARVWTEVPRPGRAPILSPGEIPLKRVAFDLFVGDTNPRRDVEADIAALTKLARSQARVVIRYGPSEAGLWRFTALSVASTQRHPRTQAVLQATMSVEFTRVSDFRAQVGPVSGGNRPAPGSKPAYYGGGTWVVRKGATLVGISNRFYKTPRYWRLIADANKIRNPKKSKKMAGGRRIKIPRVKK